MKSSVVTAQDVGSSLPLLLNRLASDEACYITDDDGRARAVLLDIDKYNAMMDVLEGRDDSDQGSQDSEIAEALIHAILARAKEG